MRIRTKLLALIAVPVLAIGLAAAIGFAAQSRAIETAEDSVENVSQSHTVFDAILAIGEERLAAAGGSVGATTSELREATDTSIAALADVGLPELAVESQTAVDGARGLTGVEASAAYSSVNHDLLGIEGDTAEKYPNATSRDAAVVNRLAVESLEMVEMAWLDYLATENPELASSSTNFGAFANASMGLTHTQIFADSPEIDSFLVSEGAQDIANLQNMAVDDLRDQELSVSSDQALPELVEFRAGWTEIIESRTDALDGNIQDELNGANGLRSLFTLLAAIGVVVGAGLIFVIYRSITTPLSSLLDRAGHVANEDLPNLVTTLRDTDGSEELPTAQVIPVTSNDEIGELVSAFNDVQVTAYDLATEQALGRRAVGEMFVNLGRRNQQLLERILGKLTELQQEEEDPEALASLFELDNIVTRMRRNAESLLVMAGATTPRQWRQSVDIENTVRAAFGEVEGYQRIDIAALTHAELRGNVVADVAHLLAELLENAVNFSDNDSSVLVSGQVERDTYVINIFDQGIGMTADELEVNNSRITDPPPLDQVPTKFLGLYVVGRLADRHGIQVRLGDAPGGGVLARVELPEALMAPTEANSIDGVNSMFATPALEESDELAELEASSPALDSLENEALETDALESNGSDSESNKAASSEDDELSPLEDRFDLDAELAAMGDESVGNGPDGQMTDLQRRFAETQEPTVDGVSAPETIEQSAAEDPQPAAEISSEETGTDAPEPSAPESPVDSTIQDSAIEESAIEEPAIEEPAIEEPAIEEPAIEDSASESSIDTESVAPPSLPRRSITPTPAPETPEATGSAGGLPTRNRGKALEAQAPPGGIERRGAADDETEPETDNSPKSAGNFSSMMTALSSGISRGLQDSETDDSDRNQES